MPVSLRNKQLRDLSDMDLQCNGEGRVSEWNVGPYKPIARW